MARGFTLPKQFLIFVLLAAGAYGTSEVCCDRLTTVLSEEKVLKSSDANYVVENQKYWSSTAVLNPACIFVPGSSSDVSTAVKILVENNCQFGVRGGGHTANPGWAGTDSGVLVSLSRLSGIEVSEDKESVLVGAGNRWGDVYTKTGEHNVTVTGGRISTVGVSGFLLGGGLSYLMHSEGFAANSVLAYEIVLANGTVATITEESAGDLFKALKGGTGNFGIVTSFELQTYPVKNVYAGSLYYSPDQYDTLFPIMETYARKGVDSDPNTHVISSFACLPSQGIDLASFYSFYSEPVTSPPAAIKPFFDVPAINNTIKVKTVKDAADELGAGTVDGLRQDMRTYSIRANAELYKQLFDIWHSTTLGLNSTSGWFSAITFQVISNNMIRESETKGGNVLGLKPAFDPLIIVSYQFTWASSGDDRKVYAVIDKLMATSMDIARAQGRLDRYIYLNYAGTSQQPLQSYGATQIDFLRKVKAKYDPNRVNGPACMPQLHNPSVLGKPYPTDPDPSTQRDRDGSDTCEDDILQTNTALLPPEAGGYNNVPGIWSEEQIVAWKNIVDRVHAKGSYIYLQLWAIGRAAEPEVIHAEGFPYVSSSPTLLEGRSEIPKELTKEDIERYIQLYVQAAKNAVHKAGFDGVEIHSANGYLPEQFLQDTCNKRTDEYGGSIENRARFVLEITDAVVAAVGVKKTGIRFSPWSRFLGMRMKDPIPTFSYVLHELVKRHPDLAYVHFVESVVAGDSDADPAHNSNAESNSFAREIWGNRPFFIAGGFKLNTALEVAEKYEQTAVAFGRLFIANPDLPTRLQGNLPLNAYNRATFYTPGAVGYTDYPRAQKVEA
ncbi:unnamed protein product [Rhizoctonia solani]|uniref:FAD-binding PCMH-type domain-containing protein n=1 Tax=Rhizoctonia solani TaxID=456999 RepID=A0A8H3D3J0_9AGAM|nr:unnamed protein product [Rhizoctonia solani]